MIDRYSIFCKECDDDRTVIPDTDSGSYRCIECDTIYYDEDGVFDAAEAEYYYSSFKGARLAGLIKEEDVPRESWG